MLRPARAPLLLDDLPARAALGPDGQHYVATADGFPYVVPPRKGPWDNSVLCGHSALLKSN